MVSLLTVAPYTSAKTVLRPGSSSAWMSDFVSAKLMRSMALVCGAASPARLEHPPGQCALPLLRGFHAPPVAAPCLKHPVRVKAGRRCVHSREFQAEERLFPELEQAREFLKRL